MKKWLVLGAAATAVWTGGQHVITAPGVVVHAVAASANEALANRMAASLYGWTGIQATCLDDLWAEESAGTWSPEITNPSSEAYGIPQALPGSRMASAGPDWQTNPRTQIIWGLGYIKGRYGTPCTAWTFERSHVPNWY